MRKPFIWSSLLLVLLLTACGGDSTTLQAPERARQFLAAPATSSNNLTLAGDKANYTIASTPSGFSITSKNGEPALQATSSLKRIQFADVSLALDVATSGTVYRLYQAAFNRTPDTAGLGYWLDQMDGGAALLDIATAFVASDEFKKQVGTNPSDLQFLTALYNNVLHRAPDQAGQDYWLKQLTNGATRPSVLLSFSESPENQTQTAAATANGIAYAKPGIAYRPVGVIRTIQSATVGDTVTLDGTGSTDANNDVISYAWSLTPPTGSHSTWSLPTTSKPLFVPDIAGTYTVTLEVSDGKLKGAPVTATLTVAAKVVAPVADTGIYKCTLISHDLAVSLYAQGHTYLDRDHDGKPCEASDKNIESPSIVTTPATPTVSSPSTSSGQCWVNGYTRKNGTHVSGYWRRC